MIPLPSGCRLVYEIRFTVGELTNEMGEWFNMIGGRATREVWYDHKGREQYTNHVQYGKAKPSHRMSNGIPQNLIRFSGEDASVASMFLIKFMDQIISHNLKEMEQYE